MMRSEIAHGKPGSIKAHNGASGAKRSKSTPQAAATSDVRRALEFFLFAHLNLAADAETELEPLGFHRTHHRILYLVAGYPGTSVGDLISTLRLTPQAVQSPMRELNEKGYIEQQYSSTDRRKRCLFITLKGENLLARLSSHQHRRLTEAFKLSGPKAVKGFLGIMESMLTEEDRRFMEQSSA